MTKILFASDLHGCVKATQQVLDIFDQSEADLLVLLGDLLYHGPRNPVPEHYHPADVSNLLNAYAEKIIAVRGNCDSEVDQMLCQFPILSDYAWLALETPRSFQHQTKKKVLRLFLTHGHLYQTQLHQAQNSKLSQQAPVCKGDILCHGHTHLPLAQIEDDVFIFNPGSTTFPRGEFSPSFGIYQDGIFSIYDLYQPQNCLIETKLASFLLSDHTRP